MKFYIFVLNKMNIINDTLQLDLCCDKCSFEEKIYYYSVCDKYIMSMLIFPINYTSFYICKQNFKRIYYIYSTNLYNHCFDCTSWFHGVIAIESYYELRKLIFSNIKREISTCNTIIHVKRILDKLNYLDLEYSISNLDRIILKKMNSI